jgi:PAS domain S-box-containing protein
MWTAVWHALVCSLAGAALAALLGAAWQLVYGIALLGEATFDAVEIGAIAVLAAVTTGLAGGVLSAAYQFRLRQLQARVAVAASAPGRPKRRRARLRALKLFANRTTQVQHAEELRRGRLEADTLRRRLHRVSADLQGLKKSYRELYDNAPVMYFRLDVEGRLVAFNDTLMRTLGYRREELARHSYVELLEPVAGKPATLPRGQVPFEGGEAETRWRKKNGDVFNVWISSVPVLDGEGGVVRYRSAALDLTEKNRLANELRARGDQLERANDRLRAINAELEGFTYVVSHDLKEPLRTLQTYGNALAEEYSQQLGADGFQYINHVIRASRRLGLLIDDLLNLSQAGRIARSAQSFDLIEAVATARQDLTDLIQRKDATVRTDGSLPRRPPSHHPAANQSDCQRPQIQSKPAAAGPHCRHERGRRRRRDRGFRARQRHWHRSGLPRPDLRHVPPAAPARRI